MENNKNETERISLKSKETPVLEKKIRFPLNPPLIKFNSLNSKEK